MSNFGPQDSHRDTMDRCADYLRSTARRNAARVTQKTNCGNQYKKTQRTLKYDSTSLLEPFHWLHHGGHLIDSQVRGEIASSVSTWTMVLTQVTSVVKKNWLRNVCLRLCNTHIVCPRRSSQNPSEQKICGANGRTPPKNCPPICFVFRSVKKWSVAVVSKWSLHRLLSNVRPNRTSKQVAQMGGCFFAVPERWSSLW